MKENVFFVSGIDTDTGKSYATGYLAKLWNGQGIRTITQKLIQTGNNGLSEDIELHRHIMGTGLLPEDTDGLTMPEIFSYPCSPHLAAEIDKRPVDFDKIERATRRLSETYDAVLLEGAGGLMVPLTRDLLIIDYIARRHYPLIFVTSGKLGSINHTLLSLEAIARRNIRLHTVVYNLYPEEKDDIIRRDTESYIRHLLEKEYPEAYLETLVVLDGTTGQNALVQARQFAEVANVTGIILTKLDGTAKGGIAVAIQSELDIPVKYIGVGESIDDLQKFDANSFVDALFDIRPDEN